MYNLSAFAFSDMVECGARLRRVASEATSMEDGANLVVSYLYDSLCQDDTGERACALVRCFVTHPYDQLEPELRQVAAAAMGREPDGATKCLTLLATAGDVPAWNDRRRSVVAEGSWL